jgi:ribosomal protein S18 acetylase RimI-like enzyme
MIRLAKKIDAIFIQEVLEDAKALFRKDGSDQWQDLDNYPNLNTTLNDIAKKQMYVYEECNEILGCIVLSKEHEDAYNVIYDGNWIEKDNYYVIHRLAVRNNNYKKGIAKNLIKEMIKITKQDNIHSIKVDTKKENIRMLTLLKSLGFKEVGIIHLLRKDVLDKERIALEYNM